MDLDEWYEPADFDEEPLEEEISLLNEYQKTEEHVVALFEELHDMVHDMRETSLLYDLTLEDVAHLLYKKEYINYVKTTESGPKLF